LLSLVSGGRVPSRHNAIIATVVAMLVFLFRVLAEGRLPNDHYMHLVWAQRLLFGDIPGRDFVDPGMPLMYTLSAIVQHVWPGPFSETLLTSAMIAVAASLTFLVATALTGSRVVALAATALEVALWPRLYGYPKILVPALTLFLLRRYVRRPSLPGIWLLGISTGLTFLLRHDLGLFAFIGTSAALLTTGAGAHPRMRVWTSYALRTALTLFPYLLFVQIVEGLAENLREGYEFSKSDAHQLLLSPSALPWFERILPFGDAEAAIVIYYVAAALCIVPLARLVYRERRDDATVSVLVCTSVMLACYWVVILRHPLTARIADAGALIVISGGWMVVDLARGAVTAFTRRPWRTAIVTASVVCATVAVLFSAVTVGHLDERVEKSRIGDGLSKVEERVTALADAGTSWPWTWYWPSGDQPAVIEYLNECTAPTDRVLMTWSAPEFFFFSGRSFGAGHALFMPGSFATPADREKMIERLDGERVPIALINETERDAFALSFPELDALLRDRYATVATFTIRDGSSIAIAVRDRLRATRTYGPDGWPCGFDDEARSSEPRSRLQRATRSLATWRPQAQARLARSATLTFPQHQH